jgi:hypothetical protein
MSGYQNTERNVKVLQEAESEARALRLTAQLKRLKNALAKRQEIKGFKLDFGHLGMDLLRIR